MNKGHHYDFTASGNPYKLVIQLFEFQFQPRHVVRAAQCCSELYGSEGANKTSVGPPPVWISPSRIKNLFLSIQRSSAAPLSFVFV